MSRARSVSQLVGANTALGNTVITGAANVAGTLAAGNTTITGNMSLTSSTTPNFYIETSNTSVNQNLWLRSNGVDTFGIEAQSNTGGAGAFLSNRSPSGAINFRTTTSGASLQTVMTLDGAGRVTMPYQPAFMAVVPTEKTLTGGADNALTDHFTSTTYNVGGHYNTSNGRFTAPVAGLYHFVADLYVYTCSTCEIYFKINGSTYIRTWDKGQGLNTNPSGNHRSYQVSLSVGDYITLAAVPNQTAALWNGGPYSSRFTGCLIR